MIQKIMIINKSGICQFAMDLFPNPSDLYKSQLQSCDPQLISGFFMALISFGENAIGSFSRSPEDMNSITLHKKSFYFCRFDDLFFVIECDSVNCNVPQPDIHEIISQCIETIQFHIEEGTLNPESYKEQSCPDLQHDLREIIAKNIRKSIFKTSSLHLQEESA